MPFCPFKFQGIINGILGTGYETDYIRNRIDLSKELSNCEGKQCGRYNQCHNVKIGRQVHILKGDENID